MAITILIPKYRNQPRPRPNEGERARQNAGKTIDEIYAERRAQDPRVEEMERRKRTWTEEERARKAIDIMAKHEKNNAAVSGNGLKTDEQCRENAVAAARRVRNKQNG